MEPKKKKQNWFTVDIILKDEIKKKYQIKNFAKVNPIKKQLIKRLKTTQVSI